MKSSQAYKILKKDGWYVVSQRGSHKKLRHPLKPEIIIFPYHGSDEIGKALWNSILKKAGLK